MLGYSRSTNLKKSGHFADDSLQATRCQTHYPHDSTHPSNFFCSNAITPYAKTKIKASAAFQKARTMVDTLLEEVQSKRNMNMSAFKEVNNINSQALEDVSNWSQGYESMPVRKKESSKRQINKKVSIQPEPQTSYWKEPTHQHNNYQSSQIERLYQMVTNQQHKNNMLRTKCETLEEENKMLKSQHSGLSKQDYNTLWNQLQNLKRENTSLRGDTVRLLRQIR